MLEDKSTHPIRRFDAAHITDSGTPLTLSKLRRQLHRVLDRHIPRGTRVALIDFPRHANVAASAIWLGELDYLRSRNARIRYLCDHSTYDPKCLERNLGNGTILLTGGGNFGDSWPNHHELRLQVIRDFPHRRIIQLPQSIHFRSKECLEETQQVLDCHPRLTLLVRDRESRGLAMKKFNVELNLCPDMAFQLELAQPKLPRRHDRILLLSRDERAQTELQFDMTSIMSPPIKMEDWGTEAHSSEGKFPRRAHTALASRWLPRGLRARMLRNLTQQVAAYCLQRGLEQLCDSSFVITDRLHAHILCLLVNQPHAIVKNSHDRLTSFHDTWTACFPRTTMSANWQEAVELARLRIPSFRHRAVAPRVRRAA